MTKLYGLLAEFDQPQPLIDAASAANKAGYSKMEAYTPFPLDELNDVLGRKDSKLAFVVFLGGVVGGIVGFGMQYLSMGVWYPLNIGGKPLNSWPAWIPITFEMVVLMAAFTAVMGMLMLNGLPELYHPVFNAPEFARASLDKFFLCIEADDPQFDLDGTRRFLETLNPENIIAVNRSRGDDPTRKKVLSDIHVGTGKWEI